MCISFLPRKSAVAAEVTHIAIAARTEEEVVTAPLGRGLHTQMHKSGGRGRGNGNSAEARLTKSARVETEPRDTAEMLLLSLARAYLEDGAGGVAVAVGVDHEIPLPATRARGETRLNVRPPTHIAIAPKTLHLHPVK